MGVVTDQVREASGAFAQVFRNRGLRRVNLALAGSVIGDWAYGIAVSIWAYQEGGAAAVGVFGVVRFIALALASPVAATLADRHPKVRVMVAADWLRVGLVAIGAVLVASDGPALFIYALALVTSVAGTAFRPAQASLLPTLADDPAELTSANVVASTIESLGFFVGPAIAAVLLATTDLWVVYAFNAGTFVWSALLLVGLQATADAAARSEADADGAGVAEDGPGAAEVDEPSFRQTVTAGFAAINQSRELRTVSLLYVAQTVVAGASLVFEVALVLDLLARDEATLGLVDATLGIGGLVGGIVALVLARRERIAMDFGFGVVLWSAPLLLIVAAPSLATTIAAMVLIGVANSLVDINAYTIIQRVTPSEVMARVFGALESMVIAGMALGALLMPALIAVVGLRAGLAVLGAGVSVIAIACLPGLRRIDLTVLAPPGVSLLRRVPMLDVLPQATLERLAASLVSLTVPSGATVFRQGDAGDRYWVIERGRVQVAVDDADVRELGPGEGFGEIALLRDVPRTATVTVLVDSELLAIDRAAFLAAVTGHPDAFAAAEREAAARRL